MRDPNVDVGFVASFDRRRILLIAIFHLLGFATIVGGYLSKHHWNVTSLVAMGRPHAVPARLAANNNYIRPTPGHDGQFVYYLAANPLPDAETASHFDAPIYRTRRIGLPASAWVLSAGGRPWLIPFVLPLLTVGLCIVTGIVSADWLVRRGLSPFLILLWTFSYPVVYAVLHTLPDVYAACWALLALRFLERRPVVTWLCLAMSILSKEMYLLVLFGIVIELCLDRSVRRAAAMATAALPALAWAIIVQIHFDRPDGPSAVANNLGAPFIGIVRGVKTILDSAFASGSWSKLTTGQLVPILMFVFLAGFVLIDAARQRRWRFIGLGQVCLAFCLSPVIWSQRENFARVLVMLPFLVLYSFATSGGRWRLVPVGILTAYGVFVAPGFV